MRDYGKVYSTFWSSATTSGMSDDGKLLALYMMTCTHNTIAGVFRLPDGYASEDLAWPIERVHQGFSELFAKGFAKRCEMTKWVWVIRHLDWNPPENPNQRKSAVKIVGAIPHQCTWKPDFMRVCGPLIGLEVPQDENPSRTVREGSFNQEQKQKQDQEQGQKQDGRASDADQRGPDAGASATDDADSKSKRGTRLPDDWRLPKAWGDWALEEFSIWTADKVRLEGDKFSDFWRAKTGKDATKHDWLATWRNWCRSDIAHKDDPKPGRPGAPLTGDAEARRRAESDAEAMRLLGIEGQRGEVIDAPV